MKAIRVRYLPQTEMRGSRYVANDGDGNRVSFSPEIELSPDVNRDLAAIRLCHKMGWTDKLLYSGEYKNQSWYVFEAERNLVDPLSPGIKEYLHA